MMKESTFKKYCLVIDEWFVNGFNGTNKTYGNKYYLYALVNSLDNKIFYIGKGKGKRAEAHIKEYDRGVISGKKKYYKIQDIISKNGFVKIEILFNNLNEKDAFKLEKFTINKFKNQITNIQSGRLIGNDLVVYWAKSELLKFKTEKQYLSENHGKFANSIFYKNTTICKDIVSGKLVWD